ncbi:hypothetical protein V7x_24870 [Crateriforma conspicua]|uniref:Uncharacterized protein n=1 Tax=Crateriforma conspicua TaxID=2527996 RepID=A0A5C6FZ68_9PLAN|nr:hypothetical protein V7x_24870 [Crateriforma conspicua]
MSRTMKANEHPSELRKTLVPIASWMLVLALTCSLLPMKRSENSVRPDNAQSTVDRLVRFDCLQFVTDFRAINS